MGVKITKSRNFDRNLNGRAMNKQIGLNTIAGSKRLKQTSNTIAPIDTGALRRDVTIVNSITATNPSSKVSWNKDYARKVYFVNNKNPQTTQWISKAYSKDKAVLLTTMKGKVIA